jgi:hypothetical protein
MIPPYCFGASVADKRLQRWYTVATPDYQAGTALSQCVIKTAERLV